MLYLRPLATVASLLLLAACTEPATPTAPAADSPASAEAAPVRRSGADIVNQHCLTCHGRGLYNAPKLDDVVAWQTRLAAGDERLWQSLLHGKQAMPARGGCFDCTDDELRAALDQLLAQVRPTRAP